MTRAEPAVPLAARFGRFLPQRDAAQMGTHTHDYQPFRFDHPVGVALGVVILAWLGTRELISANRRLWIVSARAGAALAALVLFAMTFVIQVVEGLAIA